MDRGLVVGPGASGKTRLLQRIYNEPIEYKGPNIIKNTVFNEEGKSLKFGKNVNDFTDKYPIVYIAPNYRSLQGYIPNVDAWVDTLRTTSATAIVCYVKPFVHRQRIENRMIHKPTKNTRQYTDNYPFSYQNLFYKLEQNNIEYCIINTNGDDE